MALSPRKSAVAGHPQPCCPYCGGLLIGGWSNVWTIIESLPEVRAEDKALTLTDEEIDLLSAFRRFKLRMRKDGEVFNWQSRKPEGVQIAEDTAEIVHPNEVPSLTL